MERPVYCTNCSSYNPVDAVYCMECGVALYGNGPVENERAHYIGKSLLARLRQSMVTKNDQFEQGEIIRRERVSTDAVILLIINSLRVTGILFVLGVVMVFMQPIAGSALLITYIVGLASITYLTWRNYFFSVDENNFEQQYGILQKKSVTIPFYQIQNINISRTVLDQILGLARLEIETAGRGHRAKHQVVGGSMSSAEACLVGLTLKRAKEVRDLVLRKATETKKDSPGL